VIIYPLLRISKLDMQQQDLVWPLLFSRQPLEGLVRKQAGNEGAGITSDSESAPRDGLGDSDHFTGDPFGARTQHPAELIEHLIEQRGATLMNQPDLFLRR